MGRRPQFLTMWTSPQGCSRVFMTWQVASLRTSDSNENKVEVQHLLQSSLGSHSPLFQQCPVGYTGYRSALFSEEYEYQEARIFGAILEASNHR